MTAEDQPTRAGNPGAAERGGDGFARRKLHGMLSASWLAQACYAVAKLGVPDLLRAGPASADELAGQTGADPGVLRRLLRAVAAAGVLRAVEPDRYALGPVGELLRSDAPGAGRLVALMQGEEVFRSFAEIMYTVHTGRPAFEKVYGRPFYTYLAENPAAAQTFHRSMGAQPVPDVLAGYDLAGVGTVVDLGGGTGALLAHLLSGYPDLRGVLVELPDAAEPARTALAEAGLADRVEVVAGSFFTRVPPGADRYVLARVLHNWDDLRVVELLRLVRAAMPAGGRLLVVEELLPEPGPGSGALAAAMVDLLMLVTLEGRDRTEGEYRQLLAEAGFRVVGGTPAPRAGVEGLIEAVPSGPER